jgi:chromosome segregation ATPase
MSEPRTHEPNLRELTAQIDGIVRLYEERDRRYEERFTAAKEAVTKAESAQTAYNTNHNDLTRKMDAQYGFMLPRTEAENRFRNHDEKIDEIKKELASLRESRSEGSGRREQTNWLIGIGIGIIGLILGFLSRYIKP